MRLIELNVLKEDSAKQMARLSGKGAWVDDCVAWKAFCDYSGFVPLLVKNFLDSPCSERCLFFLQIWSKLTNHMMILTGARASAAAQVLPG